jgi:ABC-2 type transport system permease protein
MGLIQLFRLLGTFFRIGILNEAAYRANFFMQILQALIDLGTALILFQTIFSYTTTLDGWHSTELLALVGIYFLMGGLMSCVLQPSMNRFMGDVRDGTLDYTLLKPADSQVLVSVREVEIWRLIDVGLGIVVIVVAVFEGGVRLNIWSAVSFMVALLVGAIIIYSFILILSTLVFWYTKIENILVIFQSMYEAGRWPVTIYPGWLRMMLTFIVPIAFAITVPAQALTGRLVWPVLLSAIALALVLFIGSRWFWRFGIRHYTGASA